MFDYQGFFDAFWAKRLVCPLTSCEVDMYLYLLKECSLGNWANTFKLPTKKCELELDFSRKTISNVRNSLQQKGLIKFKPSRVRGEIAEYQIVNIDAFLLGTQMGTQMGTQSKETESEKEKFPPALPLKEKDKEKENCLSRRLSSNELFPVHVCASAKKPATICHRARLIFEEYYQHLYGEAYYWQAKDAKAMNSILRKISFARKSKTEPLPIDDDSLLAAWKEFIHRIDKDWIMNNFSVNKIDSQYNEIISEIKNNTKRNYGKDTGWSAPEHAEGEYESGFKSANRRS